MWLAEATPPPEVHDAFDWWASIWLPGASAVLALIVALLAGFIAWRTFNLQRTIHEGTQLQERIEIGRRLREFRGRFIRALNTTDFDDIAKLLPELSGYLDGFPETGSAHRLGSILWNEMWQALARNEGHKDLQEQYVFSLLVGNWENAMTDYVEHDALIPVELGSRYAVPPHRPYGTKPSEQSP